MALKIKEKAMELKIEIIEDKPLAQAMYAAVEIGQKYRRSLCNCKNTGGNIQRKAQVEGQKLRFSDVSLAFIVLSIIILIIVR